MRGLCLACIVLCGGLVSSQEEVESTTAAPVVIIKQVNEINEDGSYTVGYEASDGTFKPETRDEEGNVEGKYGYLDDEGELVIVEYTANNSTGFSSDAASRQPSGPVGTSAAAPESVTLSPDFELEKQRHNAVLAHQQRVIAEQKRIVQQQDAALQRRQFANQRGGQRRPVFNAAQFNPNQPASQQFNTQGFNQDFQQFQQQQQFAGQQQQFAPQQQQQFAPQQQQQFVPQQQFAPQQQQQLAPQQQQQFAPQQFALQQQFRQQQAPPPQIPTSQLTLEDIALQGFSRDEDGDGQIDPLPAHLQQAQPQFAPQQFAQQPQQFAQQPQQFAQQPQQFVPQQQFAPQQQAAPRQFRGPAPVPSSPAQNFQTGF